VEPDGAAEDRLAMVQRIIASPPRVHPNAPNGAVWQTDHSCYSFMARHVRQGIRTLETGVGLSTVLLAAWGCRHLAIVPFQDEADVILAYCSDMGIDTTSLTIDVRPSEVALPDLVGSTERDLVFIDGGHGFPVPIIDWFYGAGLLRKGGVVVFDDVQLPQVSVFLDTFIELDDRWQRLEATPKWRAYRRMSAGSLSEGQWEQPFFTNPAADGERSWYRALKDAVPPKVRNAIPVTVRERLARTEAK
jgi:hypothetical protein